MAAMKFLTANDRPGAHPASWYAATVTPPDDLPQLAGETRADVCVVGGGYAGLSAALHLAEAGLDVVLLEAHRVGWGASGRNGGQVSYGPRADIRDIEARVGREDAARIWEISTEATALVKALIARHAIDCDLTPGYLETAWRPSHAAHARAYAEHVATRYAHRSIRALSAQEMRARVDSPRYHGGLEDREAAHLHPLAYALGLARAAREAGARLFERSTVTGIDGGKVATATGTVRADWVILACNGYLDGLSSAVAARVMPINNFIIATEPLGSRGAALIPGNECVADTRFVLNYYRLTPDRRLLFGGGETYSHRFPRDIKAFVRRPMLEIFPQLADVRIDYGWGGTLAITRPRTPLFCRLGPRALSVGGWSGAGVHMATMGGRIAAEAVRGTTARWDVMARAPGAPFPGGERLRPALLALSMTWYALRDRL
jgi:gamma-glutamylputrescine oxidase